MEEKLIEPDDELRLSYDFVAKMALSGEAGVGKSSLVVRYTDGSFGDEAERWHHTVVDSKTKGLEAIDGVRFRTQIFDAQKLNDNVPDVNSSFRWLSGMGTVIVVFSVVDRDTFMSMRSRVAGVRQYAGHGARVLLAGNKCDMASAGKGAQEVSETEIRQLAAELSIPDEDVFPAVSAKTGEGVSELFRKAAQASYDYQMRETETTRQSMLVPWWRRVMCCC